jgi:hypothetical protein
MIANARTLGIHICVVVRVERHRALVPCLLLLDLVCLPKMLSGRSGGLDVEEFGFAAVVATVTAPDVPLDPIIWAQLRQKDSVVFYPTRSSFGALLIDQTFGDEATIPPMNQRQVGDTGVGGDFGRSVSELRGDVTLSL